MLDLICFKVITLFDPEDALNLNLFHDADNAKRQGFAVASTHSAGADTPGVGQATRGWEGSGAEVRAHSQSENPWMSWRAPMIL